MRHAQVTGQCAVLQVSSNGLFFLSCKEFLGRSFFLSYFIIILLIHD